MMNMIQELDLLEKVDAREKMLGKVEVLEKVKELVLLPNTELMTTRMVAEWYEVDFATIEKTVQRNRSELESNGFKRVSYNEIKDLVSNSDIMSELRISRQGANVFSKRAVLNIGMLLRDSEVAKRLRTALLDQQEVMTDVQKTAHIDEEQALLLSIIASADPIEQAVAIKEYRLYKDRHINQLEETIKVQEPMVEKYGVFISNESTFTFTELAKMISTRAMKEQADFKVSVIQLTKLLREKGILSKRKARGSYVNLPNLEFEDYFNVAGIEVNSGEDNSFTRSQTRVKAQGVDFIYNLVKNHLS